MMKRIIKKIIFEEGDGRNSERIAASNPPQNQSLPAS